MLRKLLGDSGDDELDTMNKRDNNEEEDDDMVDVPFLSVGNTSSKRLEPITGETENTNRHVISGYHPHHRHHQQQQQQQKQQQQQLLRKSIFSSQLTRGHQSDKVAGLTKRSPVSFVSTATLAISIPPTSSYLRSSPLREETCVDSENAAMFTGLGALRSKC